MVERLPAPKEFFAAAHHRLLCLGDASLLLGGSSSILASAGSSFGVGAAGGGGATAGTLAGRREAEAEVDRELCLRAMAAAYHVHAGARAGRQEVEAQGGSAACCRRRRCRSCFVCPLQPHQGHTDLSCHVIMGAGVIGPVEGIPHLLALMDATASRSLRCAQRDYSVQRCALRLGTSQ